MRYRMLETIREFGQVELTAAGEDSATVDAMAAWARRLSTVQLSQIDGAGQVDAVARIRVEQDNLVDVLRRALRSDDAVTATDVYATLTAFWTLGGNFTEIMDLAPGYLAATRAVATTAYSREPTARILATVAGLSMFNNFRQAAVAAGRLKRVMRAGALAHPLMDMMAECVLAMGRPDAQFALLAQGRDSPEAIVSAYAHIISAQVAENHGHVAEAVALSLKGYHRSVQAHDVWCKATSASMLSQLYSQTAQPTETLRWVERARSGLVALSATDELNQLAWVEALNLLGTGRVEAARAIFTRLAEIDDFREAIFNGHLNSMGHSGLAEVERLVGDRRAVEESFRRALEVFDLHSNRSSPWFLMLGSACLSSFAMDGIEDAAFTGRLRRRMRSRVLAVHRVPGGFSDAPVLGCALVGLSASLLFGPAAAGSDRAATGLTLLVLAERLNSRQDAPSTHRSQHFDHASTVLGKDSVDVARAGVAGLSIDDCTALALRVLGQSRAVWGA
jgi:hypothetical protein